MINKDWRNYQNNTYNNEVCKLLIKFLDEYNINNAIDLGCGAGNETVYMIKRGIKVIACDRQLNKDLILNRLNDDEKEKISFVESDFVNISIPKTQCICAFFSIPFCNPKEFNNLWDKIYNSLENEGYFVGQLFGDRDAWSNNKDINTFTTEQVKRYLEKYQLVSFKEVEYVRKLDNKKWHSYNIIAKKVLNE